MAQNQTLREQSIFPPTPASGAMTLFTDASGNLRAKDDLGYTLSVYPRKLSYKLILTQTGHTAPFISSIYENAIGLPNITWEDTGYYTCSIVESNPAWYYNDNPNSNMFLNILGFELPSISGRVVYSLSDQLSFNIYVYSGSRLTDVNGLNIPISFDIYRTIGQPSL